MEYVLFIAIIFLVWRVLSLSREVQNLKIEKEVGDRFTKANIDTLYKRTERILTANDPDIQKYMAPKVPFHMSLPSIGMYSKEQLEALEKEYDKKWEKFLDYKERLNK